MNIRYNSGDSDSGSNLAFNIRLLAPKAARSRPCNSEFLRSSNGSRCKSAERRRIWAKYGHMVQLLIHSAMFGSCAAPECKMNVVERSCGVRSLGFTCMISLSDPRGPHLSGLSYLIIGISAESPRVTRWTRLCDAETTSIY